MSKNITCEEIRVMHTDVYYTTNESTLKYFSPPEWSVIIVGARDDNNQMTYVAYVRTEDDWKILGYIEDPSRIIELRTRYVSPAWKIDPGLPLPSDSHRLKKYTSPEGDFVYLHDVEEYLFINVVGFYNSCIMQEVKDLRKENSELLTKLEQKNRESSLKENIKQLFGWWKP
jgi:hypothetical protein